MTQLLQTLLVAFLAVAVFAAAIALFGGAHALALWLRRRAGAIAPGADGQFPLMQFTDASGTVVINPNLVPAVVIDRDGGISVPDLSLTLPWLEQLMQRQQAVQLTAAATRNGGPSVDPRLFSDEAAERAISVATGSMAQAFAQRLQQPQASLVTANDKTKRQISADRVRKLADRINRHCFPNPPTEANARACTDETDNAVIQAALRELEARGLVTPARQGVAREWTEARIPALMEPA